MAGAPLVKVIAPELIVLGGNFWDKLRALYVHRATVLFPEKQAR